jgi:hypothetical protein
MTGEQEMGARLLPAGEQEAEIRDACNESVRGAKRFGDRLSCAEISRKSEK